MKLSHAAKVVTVAMVLFFTVTACGPGGAAITATVTETGSTLMLPLMSSWQFAYENAQPHTLVITAGTGSGVGIAAAEKGTDTIGASDVYLPRAVKGVVNVPLVVAGVAVNYNVPGLKAPLRLNGQVLANIYAGKIGYWDDSAIASLNTGDKLPHLRITPLHRSDSSGSTFQFTAYLSDQSSSGWPVPGKLITWPAIPAAHAEKGSDSMLSGCVKLPGCITYIGVSYSEFAKQRGLGTAALANGSGKYVLPTTASISQALAEFAGKTPANGSLAMVNAHRGYPLINYEYAIVKTHQPNNDEAVALRQFLTWDVTRGSASKYLAAVNFVPLPASVLTISKALIASIK